MHSQNKDIAGIDTETTNIEPGTRRWAVDSIRTKQWRPKAMLPLIGCRSLFVAALESFLNHPVLQLVTIRRKELRTQERRGVIDVVFLRLLNAQHQSPRKSEYGRLHTYPLVQLGNLDVDRLRLLVPLQLVEPCLFLDNLPEKERK